VPRGQLDLVRDEIARGLLRYVDPKSGQRAIANVYARDEVYRDRGNLDIGPDLILGFARGVRGSDESALGQLSTEIMADNTSRWSGDHMADHEVIPGILLTNRPLQRDVTSLKNLAAAVLAEFGIEGFPPRE
jgi:predicted AlkP superfamily phosphohydrolase/phosphomutase